MYLSTPRGSSQMAIPLVRAFDDISGHTIEVHRLENEGDRIVRGAIASLFEEGIDPMVVIRWKESSSSSRTRSTRPSARR